MGFWGDTWDTMVEQATLGPPGSPGRSTPAERTAYEQGAGNFVELARNATAATAPWGYDPETLARYEEGVRELPGELKSKAGDVITLAGWLTKPWVLALIGGTVVLFIAAPYAAPFLKRS